MIPETIQVNRRRWKVELQDELITLEDGTNGRGFTCTDTRTIELADWLLDRPRLLLRTFIHEYLHAVEHEYDLKIPHKMIYELEKPLSSMVVKLAAHWEKMKR